MQSPSALTLPANWLQISLALMVSLTLAVAFALAAGRVVRRLAANFTNGDPLAERVTRGTVRIVRFVVFGLSLAVFAFPALDLAGVPPPVGLEAEDLGAWAAETGIRIAVILVIAFAVVRVMALVIGRAEKEMAKGTGAGILERQKRAQTVSRLLRGALRTLIWATALLVILRELDIDITPVLTGAGILGLAIGFGAQTLVRDVISGFFLIVEDQVRVGDVAKVNGTGGLVEQINLRTIVLRDLEGIVHVFPNGSINTLANLTKDFSFYVIDMGIDYEEDTDRAVEALKAAAAELMAEPKFAASILEPLEILGVDAFADSQVTVKVRIKTLPLKQWEVGRELRRRIKKTFDARGITIPFPQRTVTMRAVEADEPASSSRA